MKTSNNLEVFPFQKPIKRTSALHDILKSKDIHIIKVQGKQMSIEELLRAGIAAAKANDSVGASNLLSQVVRADPNSELGWLWLGYCRDVPQQREYCFRKVLSINPENVEARRQIEILNHPVVSLQSLNSPAPQSDSSLVSNSPVVEAPTTTPPGERNTSTPRQAKGTIAKKARRNGNTTFIWIGIGIIILVCIAIAGIFLLSKIMNLRNSVQPSGIASVVTATPIVTRTPNYTPSFETTPCEIVTPIQVHVTCGFVHVPEDRNGDLTDTIQLAVTIYHNTS
jgi:hypothetical protein